MIRAKMRCNSVETPYAGTEILRFMPIYDADPNGENHEWSAATPAGQLELYITNPGAQGQHQQGTDYWIDISPVTERTSVEQQTARVAKRLVP